MRTGLVALVCAASALVVAAPAAVPQTEAQDGPPICGTKAGSGPATTDDGVLRIATYNILHTQPSYADETLDTRVELIADALAGSDADLIGMQEVVKSTNHGAVAQRVAAELGERTGDEWSWCFFQSNPHFPGEPDQGDGGVGGPISQQIADVSKAGDAPWGEGVAILSRFGIADAVVHRLVQRAIEAPACQVSNPGNPLAIPTCVFDTRTIMWARIATSCGDVDLFTSHLANNESGISEQIRQLQTADAVLTMDDLSSDDAAPDFYVGDFNTLQDGPIWQAIIDAGFVDGWLEAEGDAPGLTSGQDIADPASTVSRRIDFVFARPGSESVTPSDGEILGDAPAPFAGSGNETVVWPSDHYGVAVSFPFVAACSAPTGVGPGSTDTTVDLSGVAGDQVELPATGGSAAPLLVIVVMAAVSVVARRTARGTTRGTAR